MSNTVDISLDSVLSTENLERARAAVKANAGAGGVDGKGIVETEAHLKCRWPVIREKLLRGDYRPAAVRAVDIAKPGGGTRRLGIPTVQDRLIQQALHQVLSAAFDGDMSEHSWGFRPERSAHDAVTAARGYVAEGKEWVADIDLASFFDQVNHDRLMHLLGQRISDKRITKLIGRYLRAPMDEGDGRHIRRSRGTPQGGPLTPPTMLHKRVISRRERTLIDAKYHVNALGVNLDAFDEGADQLPAPGPIELFQPGFNLIAKRL